MLHTHYHAATKRYFSLDNCEACNCEVMAPNAVTLHNPLDVPGLIYVDSVPDDELYWNDNFGGCVCLDCDSKYQD